MEGERGSEIESLGVLGPHDTWWSRIYFSCTNFIGSWDLTAPAVPLYCDDNRAIAK